MHEAQYHEKKCFLTLTYDDIYLPPQNTLVLRDLQLFLKRLRKELNPPKSSLIKIRYFACGEYGDDNGRPHYHLILYGVDFPDRKAYKKENGHQLWKSETADRIWGKGFCPIGSVSQETCGYVARYLMKKVNGELALDHYSRINPETGEWYLLKPEFIVMSRRPGIGTRYYEDYKTEIFTSDSIISNGVEIPVPSFYTKKLALENEILHEEIKSARQKRAAKNAKDNTPERLAVRKECLISKTKPLVRPL